VVRRDRTKSMEIATDTRVAGRAHRCRAAEPTLLVAVINNRIGLAGCAS
jgi:hypothetical protein